MDTLLRVLLLTFFVRLGGGQEFDQMNNDLLLNAIHTNETPIINDIIGELR